MTQVGTSPLTLVEHEAARLYRRLSGQSPPSISIRFYPYSGLRHTIRKRDQRLEIRISDVLEKAPLSLLSAVATILLFKLFRVNPPNSCRLLYREYISRNEIVEQTKRVRRSRSKISFRGPRGQHFDLQVLFDDLNMSFFNNEIEMEQVSWSRGASRRRLGHFDPAFNAIVISRVLDREDVPECVVSFVLYHEMLHAFLGETVRNGKRFKHHPHFRAAEQDFPAYAEAVRFLEENL